MSYKTVVLLLLLGTNSASSNIVNETRLSEIVTIVTDVITTITTERAGTVYCWFYSAQPDPQPDDLLERILRQPALRYMTRFTLVQLLPVESYQIEKPYRMPTILLMDFRNLLKDFEVPSFMSGVPRDTYVLIFISALEEDTALDWIWEMLEGSGLANVFFLRTDERKGFYENRFSKRRTYVETFPSRIFPDHTRDVHGYHLRTSHLMSSTYACFLDGTNQSAGPIIDWVQITAQLINATFDVTRVHCSTYLECHRNLLVTADRRLYDLVIDPLYMNGARLFTTAVRSIMPAEYGLIAPRSPRLQIHELFGAPFRIEVWITVGILLVTCSLLTHFFPNQFQNNLTLLTLCAFERIPLYRVKRLEKTVAISLIFFFFVLLSAYESLFISLMTNRPRLRNPRTVQDLLEASIKLELCLMEMPLEAVDEVLQPIVKNVSKYPSAALNGRSAYSDTKENLRTTMAKPDNFDQESGESHYVMLEYSRWEGFQYHMIAVHSPMLSKFRYTQTVLEESGIYQRLKDRMEHKLYGARWYQILVRRFVPPSVILGMQHMTPVWIVLGVGWMVSCAAVVVELGWHNIQETWKCYW